MSNLDFNTPASNLPHIIEQIPAITLRLGYANNIGMTFYINKQIQKLGYTVDDFMSGAFTWTDLIHPQDKASVITLVKNYSKKKITSFSHYYRVLSKNGDVLPAKEYQTVHYDENGIIFCRDIVVTLDILYTKNHYDVDTLYGYQVSFNDILVSTQNMAASEAITFIIKRIGQTLDLSRILLFKDNYDHKVCKIVSQWCNTDIAPALTLSYSITYETEMPELYQSLRETGLLLVNAGAIPVGCKEIFATEGVLASAFFSVFSEGQYYGFIAYDECISQRTWDVETTRYLKNCTNLISNILTREEISKKLVRSQRAYEEVLNNIQSYAFVTCQKSQEILFANKAFKEAFDMDCVGRKIDNYLQIDLACPLSPCPISSRENPEIYCKQTQQCLSLSSVLLTWVDGQPACLTTCYDLTSEKLFTSVLEEKIQERTSELKLLTTQAREATKHAENATLAKSHFLANMSHEIRTPMNAILGLLYLVMQTDLTDLQNEYLGKAETAATNLLRIINDILDFSKIEAGQLEIEKHLFNLSDVLQSVHDLVGTHIHRKGLKLIVDVSPGTPNELIGDQLRLVQVLNNLTSNALKFTENGQITVKVKVLEEGPGQLTLRFLVCDTGIGLTRAQAMALFTPFSQADTSTTRRYGGSGLGLVICRRLVEMMAGTIWVESEAGHGSTFGFTAQFAIDETQPPRVMASNPDFTGLSVLVIDDHPVELEYMTNLLEKIGLKVQVASSGKEALNILSESSTRNQHPDLIFVDWKMPGLDGIETINCINKLLPPDQLPAVIMTTAYSRSQVLKLTREKGFKQVIAKPLSPSVILEALAGIFSQAPSSQKMATSIKESREKSEAMKFNGERLLLAEDNEVNQLVCSRILKNSGLRVDIANNGQEAVEMAKTGLYQLILMDIQMPVMDGLTATAAIRALPGFKTLPIVAMTAHAMSDDREICLQAGMNDHISKPINIQEIFSTLTRWLKR